MVKTGGDLLGGLPRDGRLSGAASRGLGAFPELSIPSLKVTFLFLNRLLIFQGKGERNRRSLRCEKAEFFFLWVLLGSRGCVRSVPRVPAPVPQLRDTAPARGCWRLHPPLRERGTLKTPTLGFFDFPFRLRATGAAHRVRPLPAVPCREGWVPVSLLGELFPPGYSQWNSH